MATRIYCAGEIASSNDWRESIVPKDMLYKSFDDDWEECHIHLEEKVKVIYTGPYLVLENPDIYSWKIENLTYNRRLESIDASDLVLVHVSDCISKMSLIELGYAKGKGKMIWIVKAKRSRPTQDYIRCFADMVYDIRDGLRGILECNLPPEFDSPIEEKFWYAWRKVEENDAILPLTYQHSIGKYRVDFAFEYLKIAIELDGHASHSSPDAIAYDRKRQREIEAAGWKVIRFGGKEIYTNAYDCALEAYTFISNKLYPPSLDA